MKKTLSLILALLLCLSLCACMASNENPTIPSTEPTVTDPTVPTDPTIEQTDATDPTQVSDATEATDPTETSEPTAVTDATETPAVSPTETPTETPTAAPTETTAATPTETTHAHSWTDATCTAAQVCTTCQAVGAPAKGHNWVDASYISPKSCTRCGLTEGSILVRPPRGDYSGVTITIATPSGTGTIEEYWLYQEIEKAFGCTINVQPILEAAYYDRVYAMIAQGNTPTIFMINGSIEEYVARGESGQFVDVMAPENLAKMPNFKSLFVDNKINNDRLMLTGAADGSHYLLPGYNCRQNVEYYWFYNNVAFEEAGVQWDGDPDGFLDMLRKLKAYDPNSYPLSVGSLHNTLNRVISSFGVNSTYAAYDWSKGDWFFGATSNASYEMLRMYQTAYNEKLLNPANLKQGAGAMTTDIENGESYLYHGHIGWTEFLNSYFSENTYRDGSIIPASAPVGTNGMTLQAPSFSNTSGTVISAEDPRAAECAMAILDWMYDTSKDGGAWLNTVGDPSMLARGDDGLLNWICDYDGTDYMNDRYYVSLKYGMFDAALAVRICPESPHFNKGAAVAEAQKIGDQVGYFRCAPALPEMDGQLNSLYADAQEEIKRMQLDFITQNWTRADFDEWSADFNATYSQIIDYLNGYF